MQLPLSVKLFTLRTRLMNKAIVQIGYNNYVLDTEKAIKLLSILDGAERYETKWRNEKEGGTTYHVWNPDDSPADGMRELKLMPEQLYRLAKLAGKPE